jgi:hypothetical protein
MVVAAVENMCQRRHSPIEGRRGSSRLLLGIDQAIALPKREAFQRVIAGRQEHLELQRITVERGGESWRRCPSARNGWLARGMVGIVPLARMAWRVSIRSMA